MENRAEFEIKGFAISKQNIFWQGSVILSSVMWPHVNNCSCKRAVECLYQEGVYDYNNVWSPSWWTGGLICGEVCHKIV